MPAQFVEATRAELELVLGAVGARKARALELKEAAVISYSAADYARAVDELSSAITLDECNHVFWSNRSAAHMALQNFDAALADADECVRLQPGWAKGHARRAAALLALGRLVDARRACAAGLEIEPNSPQVPRSRRDRAPRSRADAARCISLSAREAPASLSRQDSSPRILCARLQPRGPLA